MMKKNDTSMIRILELIAFLGEVTADEIKSFSKSPSYAEKLITLMKKESYIKNFRSENRSTYRLMIKGKKYLEENLPESFLNTFHGQTTMNRVRYDKRREERRRKLADILLLFYRADVKIFPDEKQLLKNTSVNTDADPTDNTDEQRLEFYTSVEIKKSVPDYVKGLGSRSLGVLIAYGELYIVYLTYDGNLLWRKDTEIEFYNNTKNVLARKLFGKNNGTYLLVISDDKMVPSRIMKRRNNGVGKIYPAPELHNMIFALKDTSKDPTLDFILKNSDITERLEAVFKSSLMPDSKKSYFDGVNKEMEKDEAGNIITKEIYGLCAFKFNLFKVMEGVYAAYYKKRVMIFCFDYQREYIEKLVELLGIDENNNNLEILSNSIEGYKENYLK